MARRRAAPADGGERLPGLIVQFAGDPLSLGLLGADHAAIELAAQRLAPFGLPQPLGLQGRRSGLLLHLERAQEANDEESRPTMAAAPRSIWTGKPEQIQEQLLVDDVRWRQRAGLGEKLADQAVPGKGHRRPQAVPSELGQAGLTERRCWATSPAPASRAAGIARV